MASLSPLDNTWLLLSAFLVMTMQAGFCMLEAGLVRSKNSINVAFKNLMDFAVSALLFWLIGFGIMFGASAAGFFGTSGFAFDHTNGHGSFFLYQLMFCGAATTIISGAIAERTRFSAYLFIAVLMAALIYPVSGHWVWGGQIEGPPAGWLNTLGFIDYAGGTVVHVVGGMMALAACLIIGPRIGRFDKNKTAIQGCNYPLATVGVMILWFGWFGFNGGSALGYNINIAQVVINTSLSATAGATALVVFSLVRTHKPDISAVMNGTLAGLVGITAGCHLFSTVDAVVVGVLSAAICQAATTALVRFRIDDAIGAVPAHAAAGILGTLLLALLGDSSQFPNSHSIAQQFGIQAFGVTLVALWAFGIGYFSLSMLNHFIPLRVSADEERRGLNIAEHGASTEVLDLLTDMSRHTNDANFTTPVAEEPHTEVGQIAREYNQVLDRVRLEIQTREEAYQQLHEATKFQFIFENAHEGIVQMSMDGDIQKANPAAARILGFTSAEQLVDTGGRFLENIGFKRTGQHQELLEHLQRQQEIQDLEFEIDRRCDQQPGFVQCSIRQVAGMDGEESGYLCSVIDNQEKRLRETLQIEKEAAIAASDAKDAFLANMSHELRTPLNGIAGMLELLRRTNLDQQQLRYAHIAQTSTEDLLGVINNVLDVSSIKSGELKLEHREFDLRKLLHDVVALFQPQADEKQLTLTGYVHPDLPSHVVGDAARLQQVLVNLMSNAVKFTEQGSVMLDVEPTGLDEQQVALDIRIRDTGCGISMDQLKSLFRPFAQADSSPTRNHGGSGLGLTISRQLIELMDGAIDVDSAPGHGSSFIVQLRLPIGELSRSATPNAGQQSADSPPAGIEAAQEDRRAISNLSEPEHDSDRESDHEVDAAVHTNAAFTGKDPEVFARPTVAAGDVPAEAANDAHTQEANKQSEPEPVATTLVLLVEDNPINQLVAEELLINEGYAVETADDGQEALDRLAEGGVDLVLMDCQMPVLDGFEATRQIRERETEAGIAPRFQMPVVALTANAAKGDRQRCLAAGMNDYVTKPIDPDILFSTMARFVKQPQQQLSDEPDSRATGTR